jgi:hypothetical protein
MLRNINTFIYMFMLGLFLTGSGIALARAINGVPEIYPHESGEAVYIEGNSCVINAHKEVDEQEFLDMMFFCSIKHMEYLSEVK